MATLQTRDWAHLPPELLQTIATHLPHLPDLLRFAAVCAPWRSAAKSAPYPNLPPQLPWLLLPKHSTDTTRSFFSLSDHRTYSLPLPESRKTRTNQHFPSPTGRIITPQSIQTLALLNPFTRSSIELPPLPLTQSRRKNIGAYVLRKAKLFGPDLVAVLFPDGRDILFCRPGDASWKRLDMLSCYPYEDFVCYDGRLFVISGTSGTIWVFDVETLEKVAEIPLADDGAKVCDYLVESPSGELMLVRRKHGVERKRFELFRFEESGEEVEWVEVGDIGDAVLFVDGLQAMAFAAADFNGWRGNCVYFVDYLCGPGHKGVLVFDIGKGRIEEEPAFSFTSRGYWGKAMWVVPTLD